MKFLENAYAAKTPKEDSKDILNGLYTPYLSTKTELRGLVANLTSRFIERSIPTWTMVKCHSSGRDGITTYSIASPNNAAETDKLVTRMGNGGILEGFSLIINPH
tara:strand:+ start:1464 stop:1778 length:315 start_codon:yes stop_codon:yes gene_type:complete